MYYRVFDWFLLFEVSGLLILFCGLLLCSLVVYLIGAMSAVHDIVFIREESLLTLSSLFVPLSGVIIAVVVSFTFRPSFISLVTSGRVSSKHWTGVFTLYPRSEALTLHRSLDMIIGSLICLGQTAMLFSSTTWVLHHEQISSEKHAQKVAAKSRKLKQEKEQRRRAKAQAAQAAAVAAARAAAHHANDGIDEENPLPKTKFAHRPASQTTVVHPNVVAAQLRHIRGVKSATFNAIDEKDEYDLEVEMGVGASIMQILQMVKHNGSTTTLKQTPSKASLPQTELNEVKTLSSVNSMQSVILHRPSMSEHPRDSGLLSKDTFKSLASTFKRQSAKFTGKTLPIAMPGIGQSIDSYASIEAEMLTPVPSIGSVAISNTTSGETSPQLAIPEHRQSLKHSTAPSEGGSKKSIGKHLSLAMIGGGTPELAPMAAGGGLMSRADRLSLGQSAKMSTRRSSAPVPDEIAAAFRAGKSTSSSSAMKHISIGRPAHQKKASAMFSGMLSGVLTGYNFGTLFVDHKEDKATLFEVISDRYGFQCLMDHLVNEYSSENLLYVVEATQLKESIIENYESVSEQTVIRRLPEVLPKSRIITEYPNVALRWLALFEKYIDQGEFSSAPAMINVSYMNRLSAAAVYTKVAKHLGIHLEVEYDFVPTQQTVSDREISSISGGFLSQSSSARNRGISMISGITGFKQEIVTFETNEMSRSGFSVVGERMSAHSMTSSISHHPFAGPSRGTVSVGSGGRGTMEDRPGELYLQPMREDYSLEASGHRIVEPTASAVSTPDTPSGPRDEIGDTPVPGSLDDSPIGFPSMDLKNDTPAFIASKPSPIMDIIGDALPMGHLSEEEEMPPEDIVTIPMPEVVAHEPGAKIDQSVAVIPAGISGRARHSTEDGSLSEVDSTPTVSPKTTPVFGPDFAQEKRSDYSHVYSPESGSRLTTLSILGNQHSSLTYPITSPSADAVKSTTSVELEPGRKPFQLAVTTVHEQVASDSDQEGVVSAAAAAEGVPDSNSSSFIMSGDPAAKEGDIPLSEDPAVRQAMVGDDSVTWDDSDSDVDEFYIKVESETSMMDTLIAKDKARKKRKLEAEVRRADRAAKKGRSTATMGVREQSESPPPPIPGATRTKHSETDPIARYQKRSSIDEFAEDYEKRLKPRIDKKSKAQDSLDYSDIEDSRVSIPLKRYLTDIPSEMSQSMRDIYVNTIDEEREESDEGLPPTFKRMDTLETPKSKKKRGKSKPKRSALKKSITPFHSVSTAGEASGGRESVSELSGPTGTVEGKRSSSGMDGSTPSGYSGPPSRQQQAWDVLTGQAKLERRWTGVSAADSEASHLTQNTHYPSSGFPRATTTTGVDSDERGRAMSISICSKRSRFRSLSIAFAGGSSIKPSQKAMGDVLMRDKKYSEDLEEDLVRLILAALDDTLADVFQNMKDPFQRFQSTKQYVKWMHTRKKQVRADALLSHGRPTAMARTTSDILG